MKKLTKLFSRISIRLFILLSLHIILVFVIINYVNFHYFAHKMEGCMADYAIQAGNLIKESTRISMLQNDRVNLARIMTNLNSVEYIEGIRIYNKKGVIQFSGDSTEVGQTVSIHDEQCIFCHESEKARGAIPQKNRFRECPSTNGYRVMGLINPIENSPACYNAACHAHASDETILGLLDIQLSLKKLDVNTRDARSKSYIFYGIITIISAIVFNRIIRTQIQRPISELIQGTQQVAHLNLEHIIQIDSPEEMAKLAASFNKMTLKLKQAQEELKEWSNRLEEKVQQKTEELSQAQSQLIMAEKLASMGKLSAVVAHEINNPLSGILTYSKLMIKSLQPYKNEQAVSKAIENLKIIRDESKRCGDIVRNLLIFSKKSFGEKKQSNLTSILNRSIELVQHSIAMREIQLTTDFDTDEAPIHCDAAALEQMTVALLINAIEAIPEGSGKINIALERTNQGTTYSIKISDNGVGIDEAAIPHIFEPFYSTKTNEKSVGLGLAVVYGIVERHQGAIQVKSQKDVGTIFTIELPVSE
ncbi:MAG: sensor histidine kinase [Candidatus Zhuqueibacterota bacterium]